MLLCQIGKFWKSNSPMGGNRSAHVSGPILLLVGALASHAQPIPEITKQPVNQFVQIGFDAVFQLVATGQDPLTYQWWRQTPPSSDWVSLSDAGRISGAQTATLIISNAQLADQANYRGLVYDRQRDIGYSDVATLTVLLPPSVTESPQPLTVYSGDPFGFTAVATGTDPLTCQWQLDGVDVPGETNKTFARTAATPTHLVCRPPGGRLKATSGSG